MIASKAACAAVASRVYKGNGLTGRGYRSTERMIPGKPAVYRRTRGLPAV